MDADRVSHSVVRSACQGPAGEPGAAALGRMTAEQTHRTGLFHGEGGHSVGGLLCGAPGGIPRALCGAPLRRRSGQ